MDKTEVRRLLERQYSKVIEHQDALLFLGRASLGSYWTGKLHIDKILQRLYRVQAALETAIRRTY